MSTDWKLVLDSIYDETVDFVVGTFRRQLDEDLKKMYEKEDVSDCCMFAPRVDCSADKKFRVAKKIAIAMYPMYHQQVASKKDLSVIKTHSYILYTQNLAKLKKRYLEQLEERLKKEKEEHTENSRELRERYEEFKNKDVQKPVFDPEAMPVDIAPIDELDDFFNHMKQNIPAICDDYIEFTRGAYYNDGRIDLCKQVVGPTHINKLMDSIKDNPHIKHFLLGNNVIDVVGAKAIADFITNEHVPKIETWYIAGNRIDTEGAKLLAEAFKHDKDARSLWLKRNPLKAEGVRYISEMLEVNDTLEILDLHNVYCNDEGINYLFESLKKNTTLKNIYLDANGITCEGAKKIAEYFNYKTVNGEKGIESIWIDMNRLGDNGVKILADSLQNYHQLKRLVVGSCRMEADGAKYLLEKLVDLPDLIVLDMGMYKATGDMGEVPNNIKDEGAQSVKEFLLKNRSVQILDISQNDITDSGLNTVLDGFEKNETLLFLYYDQYGQDISSETKKRAYELMQRNIKNNLGMEFSEFHKRNLRLIKHTEEILKIDSIYRNRMK